MTSCDFTNWTFNIKVRHQSRYHKSSVQSVLLRNSEPEFCRLAGSDGSRPPDVPPQGTGLQQLMLAGSPPQKNTVFRLTFHVNIWERHLAHPPPYVLPERTGLKQQQQLMQRGFRQKKSSLSHWRGRSFVLTDFHKWAHCIGRLSWVHWNWQINFDMAEVRPGYFLTSLCHFLFQVSAFLMGLGVQEVLGYLCIFANGLSKLPQVLQQNPPNCHRLQ